MQLPGVAQGSVDSPENALPCDGAVQSPQCYCDARSHKSHHHVKLLEEEAQGIEFIHTPKAPEGEHEGVM